MDDYEVREVARNKSIRGYILRSLAKGFNNSSLVRQIVHCLEADNLIINEDIGRHLDYLTDGGYIEYTNKRINAYNAYKNDAVIRLTKKGVDLVEGTIEDPGVDL